MKVVNFLTSIWKFFCVEKRSLIHLGLGLTVFITSPSFVSAETMLEEIIVTARKKEESLQDTPISITAFSANDLQARNLDSIHEIANATPNLVIDDNNGVSGSSSTTTIFLRGVGQEDFTLNVDAGVGLYVDGVYVSRSIGSLLDLVDVERIEVLRGPQGTLFGRNTIGGAINITSKKPGDEFSGKLGITGGRFDRIEGYGSVNLPISDTLRNRTSFKVKKRDGYYTNTQPSGDVGDDDSFAGRTVFNWNVTDKIEVDFSLDGTREREGSSPQSSLGINNGPGTLAGLHNAVFSAQLDPTLAFPFGPMGPPSACVLPFGSPGTNNPACYNEQWIESDPHVTNRGHQSVSNVDLWGVSGTITWELDNFTLKSITAYRDLESFARMDLDASPLVVFDTDQTLNNEAISQELQALGTSFDDRLDWIAGFYYLYEDGIMIGDIITVFADARSGGATTTESIAGFAQGTWHFTDKMDLTVGLRYTKDERVYTPNNQILLNKLPPFIPTPSVTGTIIIPHVPNTQKANEFSPMVNLSYRWTEDFMTYFSYSEGFKGGGFTQRVAEVNPRAPSFSPEFAVVYEVGFKFTGLDNRLRLNASAFFNDYTDIHTIAEQPGVLGGVTTNAGEAEISGFELELTYLPADNWLIQAGVGYLHAKYTSLLPSVPAGITLDNKLTNTPEWSVNASASYDFQLAGGHLLSPRVDWSYTSESFNEAENLVNLKTEAFHILNASIAFETADAKWRASLNGKNLTNEVYVMAGGITGGFLYGTNSAPRTWSINLERRF